MTTSLFDELGLWKRRSVRRLFERRSFEQGAELMAQGASGNEFMVVLDGQVAVAVDGVQKRTVTAGGFFGELALLPEISNTNGCRAASVIALEPTTVGVADADTFAHILAEHPRLGGRILAQAWTLSSNLERSAPALRDAATRIGTPSTAA